MSNGYLSGLGGGPLSGVRLHTLVDDLIVYDRQRAALVPADRDYVTLTADSRLIAEEIYRRVRPTAGSRAAGTTLVRPIDGQPGTATWLARADDGSPAVTKIFPPDRLLDAGALSRFVDGVERMRDLRPFHGGCPYIARVDRFDESRLAWSMGVARRGSLTASPWRRWTARQRLDFIAQLLEGMAHVHRKGVVHGALRPSNVLLGDGEIPLITDVGGIEASGERAGRAAWVAPEVHAGAPTDPRSDVYALGQLAVAILCDLDANTVQPGTLARADLSLLPRRLMEVIGTATEADPDRRYPSAMEMLPPLKSGSGRWVALQLRRAGVGA